MTTESTLTIVAPAIATPAIATPAAGIPVTITERGTGRPVLLLHGGAGPASVTGFADLLAEHTGARVITPTHPGFGGTPRPAALSTIAGLAELYAALLDTLDLADVTVIGNSIGGWITAELALRHSPRIARIARIALVDAVGIDLPSHPVADFFALTPAQIAEHSYYDPTTAVIPDPATLPPAAREIALANREALALYGGTMTDPTLLPRLGTIDVPRARALGRGRPHRGPRLWARLRRGDPGLPVRAALAHGPRAADRDAGDAARGAAAVRRVRGRRAAAESSG